MREALSTNRVRNIISHTLQKHIDTLEKLDAQNDSLELDSAIANASRSIKCAQQRITSVLAERKTTYENTIFKLLAIWAECWKIDILQEQKTTDVTPNKIMKQIHTLAMEYAKSRANLSNSFEWKVKEANSLIQELTMNPKLAHINERDWDLAKLKEVTITPKAKCSKYGKQVAFLKLSLESYIQTK